MLLMKGAAKGAMHDVSGTPACSLTQAGVRGPEPIGLIANSGAAPRAIPIPLSSEFT